MEKAIQLFINEEFGEVRVVIIDGNPWFVAADVCRILELDDVSKAVSRLEDDEKGTNLILTRGGEQSMLTVNEPGLYRLIFSSRKSEAKKFQRWVYHEVLPSIRKTGSYSVELETVAIEREKLAVEREKLALARDNFATAQLLRDIASSSREDVLRDKLIREATKILMGEDFKDL